MKKHEEHQHFGSLIKWIMVVIIIAINLAIMVGFALEKSQATEEILSWIITPSILLFVVFGILYTKLKVVYNSNNIIYRLKPFEWKDKQIDKSEIQSICIKEFKWYQYGGFGKRRRFSKKIVSYIMHCGPIAEIILKNGRKIRFSVKNDKILKRFIKEHYSEIAVIK